MFTFSDLNSHLLILFIFFFYTVTIAITSYYVVNVSLIDCRSADFRLKNQEPKICSCHLGAKYAIITIGKSSSRDKLLSMCGNCTAIWQVWRLHCHLSANLWTVPDAVFLWLSGIYSSCLPFDAETLHQNTVIFNTAVPLPYRFVVIFFTKMNSYYSVSFLCSSVVKTDFVSKGIRVF